MPREEITGTIYITDKGITGGGKKFKVVEVRVCALGQQEMSQISREADLYDKFRMTT